MAVHGLDRIRQPLDYAEDAKNMPHAPLWRKRPRAVIGAASLTAIAVGAFFITRAVLERDTSQHNDRKANGHTVRRSTREWMPW